jgi:hypothetical protein
MLSRKLTEISNQQRAQAIVVGTYTLANRMMYLSVRLVSPKNSTIQSAYEDRLYLDEYSLRLLGKQYDVDKKAADGSAQSSIQPPKESFIDKIFY